MASHWIFLLLSLVNKLTKYNIHLKVQNDCLHIISYYYDKEMVMKRQSDS